MGESETERWREAIGPFKDDDAILARSPRTVQQVERRRVRVKAREPVSTVRRNPAFAHCNWE